MKMSKKMKRRLEFELAAISHAARGQQLIASVAGRLDDGQDVVRRLHEALLNFREAERQISLALA
jgi:hypothetical protein